MILKRPQMTSPKFFISSPCLRFILRLRFTISPFLTLPLMVIYLVGKGSAFSPARSTTGRRQKKKKPGSLGKRSGRKWEKRTENISLVSVSPATPTLPPTLPHSCNGSEGLATDSEGREERITCQYLFPPAAWIETDTLHSLSLFFPPQSQFKSSTFVWDQEDFRESPGRKQT